MPEAGRKEIFGWAMFDFANQAYTLLIITVVFGELFTTVIVGDAENQFRLGNLLWSIALATSYLLVALAGPVCGAIMDHSASRKRFLFVSYIATVILTALLWFVEPGWIVLGMVLLILSNVAYAIGENFIASFLPDLGPPERLGWISGYGWALGYVGGLVAAGFTLLVLGETSAENFERIRWVGPFAAGFFLLAAIPTFLWLRERGQRQPLPPGRGYIGAGLVRLRMTLSQLGQFRDLAMLLVSIFFCMAGIYIIISFAFIYGAQVIGWDATTRNAMFIVVQVTAAAGALGFGALQDRIGASPTYRMTLLLWIVAITLIWLTPHLADWIGWQAQHLFLVVGSVAGLSLGASQSAGRALVGILTPSARAAEFYGFWGVAVKLAGVFGILGLGLIQAWVGLGLSILFCILLFALALLALSRVDEQRGRRVALQYAA